MTENLPQINLRHQITDPEGSEKSKQDKYKPNHPPKKNLAPTYIIFIPENKESRTNAERRQRKTLISLNN